MVFPGDLETWSPGFAISWWLNIPGKHLLCHKNLGLESLQKGEKIPAAPEFSPKLAQISG